VSTWLSPTRGRAARLHGSSTTLDWRHILGGTCWLLSETRTQQRQARVTSMSNCYCRATRTDYIASHFVVLARFVASFPVRIEAPLCSRAARVNLALLRCQNWRRSFACVWTRLRCVKTTISCLQSISPALFISIAVVACILSTQHVADFMTIAAMFSSPYNKFTIRLSPGRNLIPTHARLLSPCLCFYFADNCKSFSVPSCALLHLTICRIGLTFYSVSGPVASFWV